jgi:acetyl-CoA acetyltransferase
MSEMSGVSGPSVEPTRELSRKVAIVGVGNTDYGDDYRRARAGDPTYVPPDAEGLARIAFDRALADCGLSRSDVDGLYSTVGYGAVAPESVATTLGIDARHLSAWGVIMAGIVPAAVDALQSGACDTLALVYAATSRANARQFGGQTYVGGGRDSYYYYHPWGWSSQAAHWALMFRHYQTQYGASEEDLGSVAVTLRQHASLNGQAIMRDPLSVTDYLASRYIVRPLHLFDLCLVNDGAVCIILRRDDMARDLPHVPVHVAGWGDAAIKNKKLHYMVKERLRPQLQEAGRQALDMAGLSLPDMHHFQGYDASTIHLINQLEGYGFVGDGEGLDFCKEGRMSIGGELPVNTSGGLLSEAYMHGWNHVVEATRQLRHEAGDRQVSDVETSMFSLATTESAHPLILTRGA